MGREGERDQQGARRVRGAWRGERTVAESRSSEYAGDDAPLPPSHGCLLGQRQPHNVGRGDDAHEPADRVDHAQPVVPRLCSGSAVRRAARGAKADAPRPSGIPRRRAMQSRLQPGYTPRSPSLPLALSMRAAASCIVAVSSMQAGERDIADATVSACRKAPRRLREGSWRQVNERPAAPQSCAAAPCSPRTARSPRPRHRA